MQFGNTSIHLWTSLHCFECLFLSLSSLYLSVILVGAGSVLQFVVFILKKINCLQHKVNIRDKTRIIGGSCRVTLSVAFDFFGPKLWKVAWTYEWYFVYECRFSGRDTQKRSGHSNSTCCYQIHLIFLHSEAVGMQTSSLHPLMLSYPLMPDHARCKSHLVKLSLPAISSSDCLVQLQQRQIEAT